MFDLTVKIVLGSAGEGLPKDFAQDRGRLYLGADWAAGLQKANETLPHLASQMRGPMSWVNAQLSDGRRFLLGDEPAALDAQFYHLVWFLRGRWSQGPAFLSQFPYLEAWETSVADVGHGQVSELSAEEALREASSSDPLDLRHSDENDPQGLTAGMPVVVSPDVDGGEQPVQGSLVCANTEQLVVRRIDPEVGPINVHFPRIGYRVVASDLPG